MLEQEPGRPVCLLSKMRRTNAYWSRPGYSHPFSKVQDSPGLASRAIFERRTSRRVKITQDAILGSSYLRNGLFANRRPTQDHVLGNFQPSLRDWFVSRFVLPGRRLTLLPLRVFITFPAFSARCLGVYACEFVRGLVTVFTTNLGLRSL
jgi:hypothetical protein